MNPVVARPPPALGRVDDAHADHPERRHAGHEKVVAAARLDQLRQTIADEGRCAAGRVGPHGEPAARTRGGGGGGGGGLGEGGAGKPLAMAQVEDVEVREVLLRCEACEEERRREGSKKERRRESGKKEKRKTAVHSKVQARVGQSKKGWDLGLRSK